MHVEPHVLYIDGGGVGPADLLPRLREQGIRALRADGLDQGIRIGTDPMHRIAAVILPPHLTPLDLERAVHAFRRDAASPPTPLLTAGLRPSASQRARLRRAGVVWALWTPIDDHTLRFQVNRALAGGDPRFPTRSALRVPTNWPVRVRSGKREKDGKVYSVSAHGAFVATGRPSLAPALVHFTLPLPSGDVRMAAEVVMTNVPGNLREARLPLGMGVRFLGYPAEVERSLMAFTDERARALHV